MKKRIAVIGIGRMGFVHALHLKQGRGVGRLVAVCDIDKSKTEKFVRFFGKVPQYTDYIQMLDEIKPDGVVIATEHKYHVEIALNCMKKGVAVLIEKPVGIRASEAERLNEYLKDSPVKAAMMYNQRTNRLYKKARELVKSGAIGEITRVNFIITNWYRAQCYYDQGGWRAKLSGEGGGTLINQCVHQLDLLQWITGAPKSVRAEMATVNRKIFTENEVTAVFTYPNGAKCSFTCSAHELHGTNRLEIAGTKGRLIVEGLWLKYQIFKESEAEVNCTAVKGYGRTGRKKYKVFYGPKIITDTLFGQQLNVIRRFCRALDGRGEFVAEANEGITALRMINAVYLSHWTNKEVPLDFDSAEYDRILDEKINNEINLLRG